MLKFVDTLYPNLEFVSAELIEIGEALNKPAVKKYLLKLGIDCLKALAQNEPASGESAESYLRREAVVKGQLAALETLLHAEAPERAE